MIHLQPHTGLAIKHQTSLPPPPTVQKRKEKREEKHRSLVFKYHPAMFGKQFIVCQPSHFLCQADRSISIPPLRSPILLPPSPAVLHPSLHPAAIPFPQAGAQDPGMFLPPRQQNAPGRHL